MADRFFPNDIPDFLPEADSSTDSSTDSVHRLLRLPYPNSAEKFMRAGLELKDKVVKETWFDYGRRASDPTLYTGALGTAFLLFKSYCVANGGKDLRICADIVASCDSASKGSS